MNQVFQAIYEGGVLKPERPLDLKEHELVTLALMVGGPDSAADELAHRQKEVVLRFVADMEAIPDDSPMDGFSNRDHDELIYGG